MKIGDVSEKTGIPSSTIRYYEQIGLIDRPARVSGRRVFDSSALFDLKFVKLSQSAGFTIDETKSLLRYYAEDPSPSGMWKPLAETKQASIQKKDRGAQSNGKSLVSSTVMQMCNADRVC